MKFSTNVIIFLSHASIAFGVPAVAPLEKRQTGTPTLPPGSALTVGTNPPTYSPTAAIGGVSLSAKFQWQIYKSCSDANRAAINTAWADSKKLSDAWASYVPHGAYQDTVDMYMGTRSTYSSIGHPGFDFRKQISDTIQRHQGLYEGKSDYGTANLWVYCNEDSFWFSQCTRGDDPPDAIIAYEQEDLFFNNWYITFCPQFYNSNFNIPFQEMESDLMRSNPYPEYMETYHGPPGTQAYTFFHETMHMSQLVTSPPAHDYIYGPLNVYNLAKDRNTDAAVYNSDSWSMTALAIWAEKTFNLGHPPQPSDIVHPPSPAASQPGDRIIYHDVEYVDAGAVVPQGASPVPKGIPYHVDENLWEIQNPAGGPVLGQPSPNPSGNPSGVPGSIGPVGGTGTVKAQQKPTKTVSPGKNPNPSSAPAPYATGTCSFHLVETEDCADMASNLFAIVTLYDNKKNIIGQTPTDEEHPIGKPINVKDPYNFDSKLPQVIVITGEHENDYVQFAYGSLQWTSRTTNGAATCSNGGWDPRDGPVCVVRFGDQNAVNQMDCSFPC